MQRHAAVEQGQLFENSGAECEKEQEYLFYYFLTLTGCDVLLLQSEGDLAGHLKHKGAVCGSAGRRF